MSAPRGLWDWSLTTYDKPGVKDACLALQDERGVNVNLALWCCWLAGHGRAPGDAAPAARAFVEEWDAVIRPLRESRRAAKAAGPEIDDATVGGLIARVLAVELDAERAAQGRLETLAAASEAASGDPRRLAEMNLAAAYPALQPSDFAALLHAVFG